ncbi:leucine-rich repeat protein [Tanacetum coccineum]
MNSPKAIIYLSSSSLISIMFYGLAIIYLTSATLSASYGGNETDYHALMSFKSMITHDPYQVLASWNHSFHFCEWSGISCGKRHKRLTVLRLRSQGLEGSLSPLVGNLSFLRILSLWNNTLQGTIPHELGRLSMLRRLYLHENKFSGVIPTNLSRCSNLELLSLGENKLAGSIPKEMSLLSKLSLLAIHKNNLTGGIPPFLGNITSLEIFSAAYNPFGGSIPDTLDLWKSLMAFYCHDCNLYGSIPHSIFNLTLLVNFSLSENHLTCSLPSKLGVMLPNLELLLLSGNKLTGVLPPSISNCSKLEILEMSVENQFLVEIKNRVFKAKDINDINFSLNKATSMERRRSCNLSYQLSVLSLETNQLFGNLPSSISSLVGLTTLDLGSNRLKGKIPTTIGKLQKLQELSLVGNQFSGPIPDAIGNLSLLNKLFLASNEYWEKGLLIHHHDAFWEGCKELIVTLNMVWHIVHWSLKTSRGELVKHVVLKYMTIFIKFHVRGIGGNDISEINVIRFWFWRRFKVGFVVDRSGTIELTQCKGDLGSKISIDDDRLCCQCKVSLACLHYRGARQMVAGQMGPDLNQNSSTGVKGTIGYAPPEYGIGSEMTSIGDVYSFGILVLEVMTGKNPTDGMFNEGLSLHKFAYMALPDHVIDVIDDDAIVLQSTEANANKVEECMAATIKIGVSCSVDSPPQRMKIEIVVTELQRIVNVYHQACMYMTDGVLLHETLKDANLYNYRRRVQRRNASTCLEIQRANLRNVVLLLKSTSGKDVVNGLTKFWRSTSKTPDQRLLELKDQINFLLKGSRPTPRPSSTHVPQAYVKAVSSNPHPRNQSEPPKQNPFTFCERIGPYPQPQALGTTFEARVQDYIAAHTERIGREEANHPITKNVNSISLIRGEEEKNIGNNRVIGESLVEPRKSKKEEPLNEVDVMDEVERRADDKPAKSIKENVMKNEEEEPAGVSSSHTMGDLSIDAYFRKIESIANVLKGLRSPMSDEDIVNIALEGLTTKYDNVYGINVHQVPFPDLKMVCSMLTTEEMRLKSRA